MSQMIERVKRAIRDTMHERLMLDGSSKSWEAAAVAAIEAMRTPTTAMVCINAPDMPAGGSVADIWEDMIDAALSTPNTDKA